MPAHPRAPRCVRVRCTVIAYLNDLCKDHAIDLMDMMARDNIRERDARCVDPTPHVCEGPLDWAHTISRTYWNTRWLMEGAVILCRKRHTYFTHREGEWGIWCEKRFGHDLWHAMWEFAEAGRGKPWKAEDYRPFFDRLLVGPITLAMMSAREEAA